MARILVVDDEEGIRRVLRQLLEYEGHEVRVAGGGAEALEIFAEMRPDLTFLDVKMARMDGLEVLGRMRELDPTAVVVMISGHGTIETAVEATRRGAYDFLEKPLDTDRILLTIRNALRHRGLAEENARLRGQIESRYEIVGSSFAIRAVLDRIEKVGPTDARVLITGENGTGKELVANAIHALSPRRNGPFIKVNCAAIPEGLIESELFGFRRGAFTGATEDRRGLFEAANGGTLLLDEIGEMPAHLQTKLLRVLQERQARPLGSLRTVPLDFRLICSTNTDLRRLATRGGFRQDLYFRINTIGIDVPPLRQRPDDILLLAGHFLDRFARRYGRRLPALDDRVREALLAHEWRGNVRELEHAIERAVIVSRGPRIRLEHLPEALRPTRSAPPGHTEQPPIMPLAELERLAIVRTLRHTRGNKRAAAALLGVYRPTLYSKLRKYGICGATNPEL